MHEAKDSEASGGLDLDAANEGVFSIITPTGVLGSIITRKTLQRNISVSRYSKYVEIEGDAACSLPKLDLF